MRKPSRRAATYVVVEGYGENNDNNTIRNQWTLTTTETLASSSLEKFAHQVMNSTKDNISSMLQEFDLGDDGGSILEWIRCIVGTGDVWLECPQNLEMPRLVEELDAVNSRQKPTLVVDEGG